MTDEKKVNLKDVTVNFRWILPIMFAGYIIAWTIQQNWQNQRFDSLANGQDKTWSAVKEVDGKIDAVRDKESADFTYVLEHYVKPQTGG